MSWNITRVIVDPAGAWGIEFTNVSGVTLNTGDWTLIVSAVTSGFPGVNDVTLGGAVDVPDGGTVVVGNTLLLPEAEIGGDYPSIASFDYIGIGTSGSVVYDGIGDADSSVSLALSNVIYTAMPSRARDTNVLDPFSFDTDFTATVYCFGAGTLITTPEGERVVETLRVGDLILTADGQSAPVLWLGRQTVRRQYGFFSERMQPVRIAAGALGGGRPHTDLVVTADHGMIVDGLVINASALINGSTIAWVPLEELSDQITFYHVETEAHQMILANGAPAETFIDYAGRKAFDNYQEYVDLYGVERVTAEMARPRLSSARQVPAVIKARLAQAVPAHLNALKSSG